MASRRTSIPSASRGFTTTSEERRERSRSWRPSAVGAKPRRGFTLIEIVIVMGLFVAIAGMGLFVSMDTYRGFMFRAERDVLVSILNAARSQAMNNMCFGSCTGGKAHGVHVAPGSYVIFQGYDYASRDVSADQTIAMENKGAAVSSGDIVFSPLAATTTGQTYTVTQNGKSSTITVGAEGQIVWTN